MNTVYSFIFFVCLTTLGLSDSQAASTTHFSVMTFNIENGGTQVNFQKVVEAIKRSKADIVGIQEAWGNTKRLAKELGWQFYDPKQHIVSKFPLYDPRDHHGLYVLVEVQPNQFIAMANMHLPDEPYGPDLIKKGSSEPRVIANENRVRLPTALPYITQLRSLAHQGVPVFLTGDFNSPSNLDWTRSTVNVLRNHRYDVPWPVTKTLENNGFIDSYRSYHPDPIQSPGYTWPSGRPALEKSFDNFNPTANDFPDRLDFIFTSGPTKVMESEVVGESDPKTSKIHITPWPSDHRAVISQFEVTPHVFPKEFLTPIKAQRNLGKPAIMVTKPEFKTGEVIPIHWTHAPGNGYDYIRIVPTHNDPLHVYETAARFYTHGAINGSVQYSSKNVDGNWTAWFKSSESHWPLAPGNYDIQLMLDDGMTVLASTSIVVK